LPRISLLRRRPSAATAIALIALFVSLGGVGYAAVSVPDNSVGTNQLQQSSVTHSKLRFGSVSYQDIQPGAVGRVRANLAQLQARVNGICASGQAIGAIDSTGNVTCNPARPSEFGSTGTVTVPGVAGSGSGPGAATGVASLTLPVGSSYMTFANPTVTVKSTAAQDVEVSCVLTVGANTQTRSVSVAVPADGTTREASVPLMVAGPAGTATVSCQQSATGTGTPTVSVTSAISALQTSSNN
jgi:hypothetical protein